MTRQRIERWADVKQRPRAPKPSNFEAMSDAWSDPLAFAAEVSRYYADLAQQGRRAPADDFTEPRRAER